MNLALKKYDSAEKLFLGLVLLLLIGLVFSKFLISLCTILLSLWAIYDFSKTKRNWTDLVKNSPYVIIVLVFLAFLLSGINSSDLGEWQHQLKLKLPFIFLPFVFYQFERKFARHYHFFILSFIVIVFISSLFVLLGYLNDFTNINDALGRGQSIPTPVDHIKYSLYVAFATLSCFLLYWTNWFSNPRLKIANTIIGVLLFVFLHILSVRSGLAVFYMSLFIYLLINVLSKKLAFRNLLLILIGMLLIPFIAFKTIPSLERKIGYMKYDIEMYLQGKGNSYSDSERLYSYKVGFDLFKSSPLVGTGIGDLLNESELSYKDKFGIKLRKYPHNMYLFLLAGLGLMGFMLCMITFLYPTWFFRANLDPFFLCFTIMILISFVVENTIQRSYSTAFYLFFSLIGVCYMSKQVKSLNES